MKLRITTLTGLILSLWGCAVGPNYKPPELNLPEKFHEETENPEAMISIDLTRWWETFTDPVLNQLIDDALKTNLDVKLATAKVREARAALSFAIGGLLPTIDGEASYLRDHRSDNVSGSEGGSSLGTLKNPSNLYLAGFDASWEIDLFGGRRREIEAASEIYESEIEGRRDALVTFLSEIAQNYIALRGYQNQLKIAEQNATAQSDTLELQRLRFTAGIASDLTVVQTQAQLAETESRIPTLQTQIKQTIHRLSILSDKDPGFLEQELSIPDVLPVGPPVVPAGLPSELLRRRPDVKKAERVLAAATANIGVAVADLFPKINLVGALGVQSLNFSNLDSGASKFWNVGGTLTLPIFEGGRLVSNILIQDARQEQALIQYRQTVLRSLEEVENTLVAYNREQARRDLLINGVGFTRHALDLAKQLNDAGVVDFLNVLTAQQALYNSEDKLAVSEISVSTNLIALYKALGGGWETLEKIN